MRIEAEQLQLSASDLVGFLNCRRLPELDLRVAAGELNAPFVSDPMLDVLRERGAAHEQAYIDHLAKFEPESWRVADFSAYFRRVAGGLQNHLSAEPRSETYPEPVAHCDV